MTKRRLLLSPIYSASIVLFTMMAPNNLNPVIVTEIVINWVPIEKAKETVKRHPARNRAKPFILTGSDKRVVSEGARLVGTMC
jgi:hypothetical protein